MPRFAEHAGGARVLLKREDLNHTGSHKINNVLGQALLTKRMGKTRVIAETGAGQHGVATATAAALLGPRVHASTWARSTPSARRSTSPACGCSAPRSSPSRPAAARSRTPSTRRCATGSTNVDHTHYLLGTVTGPAPFPEMVRDFHRVIGVEARAQVLDLVGRLPDAVIACVGGGSNAMGIFHALHRRRGGPADRHRGRRARASRPAGTPPRFAAGEPGVLHGTFSYLLQDDDGQTIESHSISAGLDYPGVGPEHAFLNDTGRAEYREVTDDAGDGGLRAAVPHRGHHPGDRVGPRARRRHGGRPRSSARTR